MNDSLLFGNMLRACGFVDPGDPDDRRHAPLFDRFEIQDKLGDSILTGPGKFECPESLRDIPANL